SASETFAAAALAPKVLYGFRFDERLLILRCVEANNREEWLGRKIGDLRENQGLLVLLRQSAQDDTLRTARPEAIVQAGDRLIVREAAPAAAPADSWSCRRDRSLDELPLRPVKEGDLSPLALSGRFAPPYGSGCLCCNEGIPVIEER